MLIFSAIKSINQIIDKEIGSTNKQSQNKNDEMERRSNQYSIID